MGLFSEDQEDLGSRRHVSPDWAVSAEQQLRAVCRQQKEEIVELRRKIAALKRLVARLQKRPKASVHPLKAAI